MPTDILALPPSSLNTKWKEPYASASLNQRFVGITAPGIYRGLRLEPDPALGDRTIQVAEDPDKLDHVAVYENALGFSVTYRDSTSGNITLSLAAYVSVDVVICIFVDYQTGTTTTGAFRVFTVAEFNGLPAATKNALVILGTVTVPVSGVIPAGNISLLRRTLASSNLSRGAIPNAPLVRNPGFEVGETNATYAKSSLFWDKSMTVGTGTWKTSTAQVATGMKSIELNVTSGPVTGEISQQVGVEAVEGALFPVSVTLKQLKTISSGSLVFFMEWSDVNDALLTTTTLSLDGGGIDSSFRTIDTIISAPAGAASLRSVGVRVTALSPSTTGIFGYIDNIDVFIEPIDTRYPYSFDQAFRRGITSRSILIDDPTGNFAAMGSHLRFDASTPSGEGSLIVERKDQVAASQQPGLSLGGRITSLGSSLIDSEANALKARVSAPASVFGGVDYTLMWESVPSGQPGRRLYVSATGQLHETINAVWGGTTWSKDVNGVGASRWLQTGTTISVEYRSPGSDTPWTSWSVNPFSVTESLFFVQAPTIIDGTLNVNDTLTMQANDNIVMSGTGLLKHGTRTIRYMTNNPRASFLSGASPSNSTSESFGTGSTAAGVWFFPIDPWPAHWRLTAARFYLPSTIVGSGGLLTLQERNQSAGSYTSISSSYSFTAGESGLKSFSGITAATHPDPIGIRMDLSVGSTTTALVSQVELDYDVT